MLQWPGLGRIGAMAMVLAWGAGAGTPLRAQEPVAAPEVATDPVKCWWKTDRDAIIIGEQFRVTLTCAVVTAGRTTVALDMKQFDPAALSLTPFDVLRDIPHEEVSSPPWRYLQYEYVIRLIGDRYFGRDVDIPALKITYELRSAETGEVEGVDQTLVFPALPMRVLSLVPQSATGLREIANESFGEPEARLLAARSTFIAAGIGFGFAVVFAGLAGKQLAGRYRELVPVVGRTLSSQAVARACLREIDGLRSSVAREGWSSDLAGRALAVARIAGALALQRRVAQTAVVGDLERQTGQLCVRSGFPGRKRHFVSASTAAGAIDRRLARSPGLEPKVRSALEDIRDALRAFSAAQYGRHGDLHPEVLDAALDSTAAGLRRLPSTARWPARKAGALARFIESRGAAVWSR